MLELFRDKKLSRGLSWNEQAKIVISYMILTAEGYLVSYYLYFILSSICMERLVFIMKATIAVEITKV